MEKISVSDLSVGDWVQYEFPEIGKKSIQVNSIEEDNHIGAGGVGASAWSDVSNFKPIPLTPEILEKNGFVKNGEYDDWNIGTWRTPYLLGVSLERPAITIKWNGSSIFIAQAKYVHQLQHALRLAGVEKEIEV